MIKSKVAIWRTHE